MKKSAIALLLSVCLLGSLAACNKTPSESGAQSGSYIESSSEGKQENVTEQTISLGLGESFQLTEYGKAIGKEFASVHVEDPAIASYAEGVIRSVAVGETRLVAQTAEEIFTFPIHVKTDVKKDFKLNPGYFHGKKVVFYGDSISAKVGCNGKDYIDLLKESLGFDFTTHSQGGALYTHWTALGYDRESACNLIVSNPEDNKAADYAFLFFGTNDFARRVNLGTNADAPTKLNDVKTLKGAVRFCVNELRKENPDLKIMLLTPLIRSDRSLTNDISKQLYEYGEAIEEMAGLLDCRSINLYEVFTAEELTGKTYSSDKIHPNVAGHQRIAEYLLQFDSFQR